LILDDIDYKAEGVAVMGIINKDFILYR